MCVCVCIQHTYAWASLVAHITYKLTPVFSNYTCFFPLFLIYLLYPRIYSEITPLPFINILLVIALWTFQSLSSQCPVDELHLGIPTLSYAFLFAQEYFQALLQIFMKSLTLQTIRSLIDGEKYTLYVLFQLQGYY